MYAHVICTGEERRDRDVHQQRLGEAVEGAVPHVDNRAGQSVRRV